MKQYTEQDLKILTENDFLDMIRNRAESYLCLPDNPLSSLVKQLCDDGGVLDALVHSAIIDDWHLVFSKKNWLKSNAYGLSEKQLFFKICRFPEAGVNSIRSEILVNAFSNNISLYKDSKIMKVKGNQPPKRVIELLNNDYQNYFAILFNEEWSIN